MILQSSRQGWSVSTLPPLARRREGVPVGHGVHPPPSGGERDTSGRRPGRSFLTVGLSCQTTLGRPDGVIFSPLSTLTEADPPKV